MFFFFSAVKNLSLQSSKLINSYVVLKPLLQGIYPFLCAESFQLLSQMLHLEHRMLELVLLLARLSNLLLDLELFYGTDFSRK